MKQVKDEYVEEMAIEISNYIGIGNGHVRNVNNDKVLNEEYNNKEYKLRNDILHGTYKCYDYNEQDYQEYTKHFF